MNAINNTETAERLFFENKKLVYYIINRKYKWFIEQFPAEKEELEGEGFLSLWLACKTFDESKGFKFSTYAFRVIYGKLMIYVGRNENLRNVRHPISLDATVRSEYGEPITLLEALESKYAETFESNLETKELFDSLHTELNKHFKSSNSVDLFFDYYIDRLSYDNLGKKYNMNYNTLKSRIYVIKKTVINLININNKIRRIMEDIVL